MNPLTDPEQFQKWKEARLTKAFLQYLRDYQGQLAQLWAQGQPMTEAQQSQAETMGDLANLDVNDVRRFYQMEQINGE